MSKKKSDFNIDINDFKPSLEIMKLNHVGKKGAMKLKPLYGSEVIEYKMDEEDLKKLITKIEKKNTNYYIDKVISKLK